LLYFVVPLGAFAQTHEATRLCVGKTIVGKQSPFSNNDAVWKSDDPSHSGDVGKGPDGWMSNQRIVIGNGDVADDCFPTHKRSLRGVWANAKSGNKK